jgi:hypothetical protein
MNLILLNKDLEIILIAELNVLQIYFHILLEFNAKHVLLTIKNIVNIDIIY